MNAVTSDISAMLDEPDRLAALAQTGLMDSPPEEAFDRLTRMVRAILKSPVALVSLVDDRRQFFKSQSGLTDPLAAERGTALSHSFCQHVVTSGAPLVVEDAAKHPLVALNPSVREFNIVAYLGVPLTTPEGHVLGSLCAIGNEQRHWTEEDMQAMRDIAHLVMSEIGLRKEIALRRNAEEHQRVLIAELHHRVKNTLATVQALVHMSLRSSRTLEDFRQGIGPRIASLAHTHTLLSEHSFEAIAFTEVLRTELGPYDEHGGVTLEGEDFALSPQMTVTLGMVIHELTTNAVKYGALSRPEGRIAIAWTVAPVDESRQLDLIWTESGGPTIQPPKQNGFGTLLLERLIVRQLKGKLGIAFEPDGLRATLRALLPAADETRAASETSA